MTRRRQLLLALTLAGLLVALALTAGFGRPRQTLTGVVALRRDCPAGAILTADDLMQVDLPAELIHPGYLTTLGDAVGKAAVHDLHAAQLLERDWLRDRPAGIAYPDAESGGRLYTLSLRPEQANGFWLAAGNRVDVHLVPRSDKMTASGSSGGLPGMLPAVRITALLGGSGRTGNSGPAGTSFSGMSGQVTDGTLICLAVSAAEARILALAEASCTIRLVPLNEPAASGDEGIRRESGGSNGIVSCERLDGDVNQVGG